MPGYEDEVLGFVNAIKIEHDAETTRQVAFEDHRAELARIQAEREEKIRSIGHDVVDLLFRHSVQPVPIWGRKGDRSGITEIGKGWHVLTVRRYPTEGQPISSKHAIDTKGRSFEFMYTQYQRRYSGIVFPGQSTYRDADLGLLESDFFKKGLASQIARRSPYIGDIG